jgi:hypothetical protein
MELAGRGRDAESPTEERVMEPNSPRRRRAFESPDWEHQAPRTTTSRTESRSPLGDRVVLLPLLVFVAIVVLIVVL